MVGSLTGSGYKVEIDHRADGARGGWTVRLLISKPHFIKVVSGFMVCLARHTHPA